MSMAEERAARRSIEPLDAESHQQFIRRLSDNISKEMALESAHARFRSSSIASIESIDEVEDASRVTPPPPN